MTDIVTNGHDEEERKVDLKALAARLGNVELGPDAYGRKNGQSQDVALKLAQEPIPATAEHMTPIVQALNDQADRLDETGRMFIAAAAAMRKRAQGIADDTVDTVRRGNAMDEYSQQARAFLREIATSA